MTVILYGLIVAAGCAVPVTFQQDDEMENSSFKTCADGLSCSGEKRTQIEPEDIFWVTHLRNFTLEQIHVRDLAHRRLFHETGTLRAAPPSSSTELSATYKARLCIVADSTCRSPDTHLTIEPAEDFSGSVLMQMDAMNVGTTLSTHVSGFKVPNTGSKRFTIRAKEDMSFRGLYISTAGGLTPAMDNIVAGCTNMNVYRSDEADNNIFAYKTIMVTADSPGSLVDLEKGEEIVSFNMELSPGASAWYSTREEFAQSIPAKLVGWAKDEVLKRCGEKRVLSESRVLQQTIGQPDQFRNPRVIVIEIIGNGSVTVTVNVHLNRAKAHVGTPVGHSTVLAEAITPSNILCKLESTLNYPDEKVGKCVFHVDVEPGTQWVDPHMVISGSGLANVIIHAAGAKTQIYGTLEVYDDDVIWLTDRAEGDYYYAFDVYAEAN